MHEDVALLRRYVDQGCEESFRELVNRHSRFVHSAALRQVGGDPHLAQDVVQMVFTELAHSAPKLASHVTISGWLHRVTRFAAGKTVRTLQRRRSWETSAAEECESSSPAVSVGDEEAAPWDSLLAHLEEAIRELSENDRQIVVLRFARRMDFKAIGAALEITDDTAQKRATRALGKLRTLLHQRGVRISCALFFSSQVAASPAQRLLSAIFQKSITAGALAAGVATAIVVGVLASRPNSSPTLHRTPPPGIVSWWNGDGHTRDSAGQNHGLVEGNVSYVPGIRGAAFHFDGQDGTRLRIPHAPSLSLTNQITVELWFRPDADSRMGNLIAKRVDNRTDYANGNVLNYALYLGTLGSRQWGICQQFNDPETKGGYHERTRPISLGERFARAANMDWLTSSRFSSSKNLFEQSAFFPNPERDLSQLRGQWHHLAGTFTQLKGSRVQMITYFDGVACNEIVVAGSLANSIADTPIWIGGFDTAWFKGAIDEIRIYRRALTATEIQQIFLASSPKRN
jgi:RNA polymerase sigma factor (sigma-70 family)